MDDIDNALGSAVHQLSDDNYTHSLAFYRLWSDIGQTHHQTTSDRIFNAIWNNRGTGSSMIDPGKGKLIHSTAHLIVRFASDTESDHLLAPYSPGLQSRLCTKTLREFFSANLRACCGSGIGGNICVDANLIARWANLGYVEEAVIRNHILQSLISHPKLYDHQADALIILFKLAGATFEAYADPSVVDRCFELLKDHKYHNQALINYNNAHSNYRGPGSGWPEILSRGNSYDLMKKELVQVRTPHPVRGGRRAQASQQEVVALQERGWEGLPPPPIFTTKEPKPVATDQKDPVATPVITSLGLPYWDLEPQVPQPLPFKPVTAPESDPTPASPVISVTHSPSASIATLSDFTIADTSDDESSIDPTVADTSDDNLPIDPTTAAPHKTFYLDDGNVEVLCGNALFRVHVSTLSFHSPALRRMFSQTNLATVESPNGCPRVIFSDTPRDFTTLLKMIYLPGCVSPPACHQISPLTTRLSPGSLNGTKCQILPHFRPSSESPQSMRCRPSDLSYLRSFVMRIQRRLRG